MRRTIAIRIGILGFGLAACGAPDDPASDPSSLAEASVNLTVVPTGVQCVQVQVAVPSQTPVTKTVVVAPGSSSMSLALGQLPFGAATFSGSAFSVACASIGSSTPTWVSDPVQVNLRAGVVTSVEMTFRKNNPVSVNANFLDNVAEIVTGFAATYARMSDGTVKQWGATGPGSTFQSATLPLPVSGLSSVVQLAAGNGFACARKGDGTVSCWGFTPMGINSSTPVSVTLNGPALMIVAGNTHACVANDLSTIFCWGQNFSGQLGNGTTTNSTTPLMILDSSAQVFAGGDSTCAIRTSTGTGAIVSCWGNNLFGQLGIGNLTNPVTLPTTALFNTGTAKPAAGAVQVGPGTNGACALRADGVVLCSGNNFAGELGLGTFVNRSDFAPVVGLSDAMEIAVGEQHACALRRTGQIVCWGDNTFGQLGNGTGTNSNVPVPVPNVTGATGVRAGANHTCAPLGDLTVRCWGDNEFGQLGDGTHITRPTPVRVRLQ